MMNIKCKIEFAGKAMNAELEEWVVNNCSEFENEQDAIDQINYWVDMNIGRYVEVVVG